MPSRAELPYRLAGSVINRSKAKVINYGAWRDPNSFIDEMTMAVLDEKWKRALTEIGHMIGQDCSPDANGVLTFMIGDVAVSIESMPGDDVVYFHLPVGRLRSLPENILREAMTFNLFRLAPPATWLALDPQTEEILLCHVVLKDAIDGAGLIEQLGQLMDAHQKLLDRLRSVPRRSAPLEDVSALMIRI